MFSLITFQDERNLNPSTISNHISALVYMVKFGHRSSGPSFAGVPLLAKLKKFASTLQREGERSRPQTKEDLKGLNKWLEWEEVIKATESQRLKVSLTVGSEKKAHEMVSLLILAFYCHLPPSRGVEVRCLRYAREVGSRDQEDAPRQNMAYLKKDGSVSISLKIYKNSKFCGADQVHLPVSKTLIAISGCIVGLFVTWVPPDNRTMLPAVVSCLNASRVVIQSHGQFQSKLRCQRLTQKKSEEMQHGTRD